MMTPEEKLKTTKFFVEANSFEQHTLWKEVYDSKKDTWEQDNAGVSLVIGKVGKHPVNVTFFFAKINGVQVCFYHGCSQVVHHGKIDKWIEKNYPIKYDKGSRRAVTDANNFHHCL